MYGQGVISYRICNVKMVLEKHLLQRSFSPSQVWERKYHLEYILLDRWAQNIAKAEFNAIL